MSRFTSIKNAYNSRFRWLFSMDLCSACLSSLRNDFLISLKTSRYRRKVYYKKLAPLTPTCKKCTTGKTKSVFKPLSDLYIPLQNLSNWVFLSIHNVCWNFSRPRLQIKAWSFTYLYIVVKYLYISVKAYVNYEHLKSWLRPKKNRFK